MAYTTIDNAELFFQAKLHSGNGSTQSITFDGSENMQPNWVWIKERNAAEHHYLFDSVRGVQKFIYTNLVNEEASNSNSLTAFDSNGFSLGNYADVNESGKTYVSWNWKAGTSFTNDASATSVGDIDSSGSVNTDAGFSICSFTGNGSNSQTVKHGLSTAPELIILKSRGQGTYGWITYDAINGAGKYLTINGTHASVSDTGMWSNTAPTSSVFSLSNGGNTAITNPNTVTMIAYCFHSVKGYSKIGTYTGNGDADGSFVYTGFKPAFVMTKKTSSSTARNWCILDNKRSSSGANVVDDRLFPNLGDAEDSSTSADFLSNGFKLRDNAGEFNQAVSYIYMAFAEAPFVNSNGVPCNAR
jgi:hypothetical protein